MSDFSYSQIREALKIVFEQKYGYKETLLNLFQKELEYISSQEQANELFDTLYLLGYITVGLSKTKGITWKITKRTIKELYPVYGYFISMFK